MRMNEKVLLQLCGIDIVCYGNNKHESVVETVKVVLVNNTIIDVIKNGILLNWGY
jgi:hypothetical protein